MFIVTTAHIDLGVRRAIDLQYVPDPVLLALNVRAQLRLVSGFGADKEPLVIYTVEFVGQQHGILLFTIYYLRGKTNA